MMTNDESKKITLSPISIKATSEPEDYVKVITPINGEDASDGVIIEKLPRYISGRELKEKELELPAELIQGILRRGAKLIVTGPSKAGKSFLVLELAKAISSGTAWIGHKCSKGRVLYINLEIQEAEIQKRYMKISKLPTIEDEDILFWNLRGRGFSLEKHINTIIEIIEKEQIDIVIIDPIYKVLQGSENDQETVTKFTQSIDSICEAGAAVAYVHHHKKGILNDSYAQDRGSGSGVFARDADAMIDISPLYNPNNAPIDPQKPWITAWQVSYVVRSFFTPDDKTILFDWPVHELDNEGLARNAKPKSSSKKAGEISGERRGSIKLKNIDSCRKLIEENPQISLEELSRNLGVSIRTVQNYKKEIGTK